MTKSNFFLFYSKKSSIFANKIGNYECKSVFVEVF